jgi:hypothetical protein
MIKVIENFVPEIFQYQLENQLSTPEFPWSYFSKTCNPANKGTYPDQNYFDTSQFVHMFLTNDTSVSNYYSLVFPFLYFMPLHGYNVSGFWRCKSNMTLPVNVPDGSYNCPHTDLDDPNMRGVSMLYYVNDADGDTIFFKESPKDFNGTLTELQRVSPKKGMAVIFDSKIIHAGQVPKNSKNRIVVNSIFLAS